MQSVRNTRVPVMIQYTGKPGNIGLGEQGLPDTVMIEVRDAGSRLNSYHKETLRLTIDLRPYIHGEKGLIHVPSDALRRSISDILQGTSRLIETTPEEITCPISRSRRRPCHLCFRRRVENRQRVPDGRKTDLSRKTQDLRQEKDLQRHRHRLYASRRMLRNLSDTMVLRVHSTYPPKGMRAETDSVNLADIAERFTEKKFIVPLHVKGVPEGYRIRFSREKVEVSVRVGMNHFAKCKPKTSKPRASIHRTERTNWT